MLDPAMQAFADEMRARPRPRRVRLSAPGAQRLCQIIKSYWNPAGFVNIQTEIVHSGGSGEAPVWGVRSNLIAGLPRPAMTKPGGSPTSSAWACRLDRAA